MTEDFRGEENCNYSCLLTSAFYVVSNVDARSEIMTSLGDTNVGIIIHRPVQMWWR